MFHSVQMVRKIFYMTLAVIGVPVNLVAILILLRGKCGLSSCTTRYLVAMAAGDLMVIITDIMLWRFPYYYYLWSFLSLTTVCSVVDTLRNVAIGCSVWYTVMFTFDRFVAIGSQKLKVKYCTNKTVAVILASTTILFCLKNVPWYFKNEPWAIINNVSWYCTNKAIYYTDPRWQVFINLSTALTPFIQFAVILILNALILRRILMASRARKSAKGQERGENHSDPEIESRNKSIILLFTISSTFIILWLLYVLYMVEVSKLFFRGIDYDIFESVAYMLRDLSCCTNTFIYVSTQHNFRAELKRMLKYPVVTIARYID